MKIEMVTDFIHKMLSNGQRDYNFEVQFRVEISRKLKLFCHIVCLNYWLNSFDHTWTVFLHGYGSLFLDLQIKKADQIYHRYPEVTATAGGSRGFSNNESVPLVSPLLCHFLQLTGIMSLLPLQVRRGS